MVSIFYQKAQIENDKIKGNIPVLDVQYGNVWTNIGAELLNQLGIKYGDQLHLTVYHRDKKIYEGNMPYHATFGEVQEGKPLAYLNSLLELSFAINQGNFAAEHRIQSGNEWKVEVSLVK
ncbi:Adenosyl-chloride synthase [compost metagenome]